MVHHVTRKTQGRTERKLVNPHREWFIGLFFFVAIAIVGSVLNAQSYVKYNLLELTIDDTTSPIVPYDKAAAADAKEIYVQKEVAFDLLAADVPEIPVEVTFASTTNESEETEENEDEPDEEDVDLEDIMVD